MDIFVRDVRGDVKGRCEVLGEASWELKGTEGSGESRRRMGNYEECVSPGLKKLRMNKRCWRMLLG